MTEFDLGRILPIDKGEWNDTYSTEAGPGYEKLDKVTSGSGSYLSLVANNTAPLTDRESWFPYVDGASIDALVVALNTAKQNAITAAGAANTQALFAEEKGNLAHTKAGEAEAAKVAANTAAGAANTQALFAEEKGNLAHTKAGEAEAAKVAANTAAAAANDAALAISAEIAAKQNKVDQNLNTTDKTVVGAINEVNRIVSIHHADNKAVRRWNNTLSTPIGEAVGDLDFLRELPRILGLGCYLVADDLTKKKLHRDNHNFYEDGSPALLDGSEGQYMFCWNAFYYTTWEEGDYTYEAISLQPIIGKKSYYIPAGGYSAIGHGVIDRTDLTLCSVVNSDPRYRGGGNAVLTGTLAGENDPQTTMLGMPATVYGIHTALAYARKRGDQWSACWFVARSAVEILISIIYGNRHTQSAVLPKDVNGLYQGGFGAGLTAMPDWGGYNGTYPLVPTSAGVEYGDLCGSFEYTIPKADGSAYHTTGIPSFFGLKNFFGHLWFGVAGLTINATETVTEAYVMPSMFGGWNYASLTGMLKAAELARATGYIKRLSMNLLCALPTEVGASASTDFADYFYENTAGGSYGLRARWGGGLASDGAIAGAFYTLSFTTATLATAYRSVPLCFFEEDPIVEI